MRTAGTMAVLIILACGHARGQDLTQSEPWASPQSPTPFESRSNISLNQPPRGIWNGEEGMPQGTMEAEAVIGAGFGVHFGSEQHDLALTELRVGRIVSRLFGKGHWYGGHFQVLGELLAGAQFSPDTKYFIGIGPVLRYELATGTRWVPFIDGMAGVALTDIGRPDLGGIFEFSLQGGIGVKYYFRDNMSVMFQDRFFHLSSCGIYNPNHGINANVLLLGVTWSF